MLQNLLRGLAFQNILAKLPSGGGGMQCWCSLGSHSLRGNVSEVKIFHCIITE